MGRTIPSFRIAFAMEKEEWKSFRNALDKSDRKKFDEILPLSSLLGGSSGSLRIRLIISYHNNN